MKLSNQAMGAIMMALQKSILEQSDIVPVLREFEFELEKTEEKPQELKVKNPPTFKMLQEGFFPQENNKTTGSD